MAIKTICSFSLQMFGDATTTSITVVIATAPFQLTGASGTTFQPTFNLATLTPTGTDNVTASNGIAVTAALGLLGEITFTFATPPNSNHFTVTGFFEF